MHVPLALATTDCQLRVGNKSLLADVLSENVNTPAEIELNGSTCLVIHGQALVMSLGKPNGVATFGGFADLFIRTVLHMGESFDRIDVCFDRYDALSIKDGTRLKRTKGSKPV